MNEAGICYSRLALSSIYCAKTACKRMQAEAHFDSSTLYICLIHDIKVRQVCRVYAEISDSRLPSFTHSSPILGYDLKIIFTQTALLTLHFQL